MYVQIQVMRDWFQMLIDSIALGFSIGTQEMCSVFLLPDTSRPPGAVYITEVSGSLGQLEIPNLSLLTQLDIQRYSKLTFFEAGK